MAEPKYEILQDHEHEMTLHDGTVVRRIRALRDMPRSPANPFPRVVHAGDVGGFVESEDNLSHSGLAWIADDAMVYGDARVFDQALVGGTARVYGGANVYGCAQVRDDATVYGVANVYGNARVVDTATVQGGAAIMGDAVVSGSTIVTRGIHEHGVVKGADAEPAPQQPFENVDAATINQAAHEMRARAWGLRFLTAFARQPRDMNDWARTGEKLKTLRGSEVVCIREALRWLLQRRAHEERRDYARLESTADLAAEITRLRDDKRKLRDELDAVIGTLEALRDRKQWRDS